MTLQAIIIRADGALAETEDVRRRAFAQTFSEAGFEWSCDREGFALTAKLGSGEARMAHYVRSILRGKPETQDLSYLIHAMHRRASKLFGEMLSTTAVEPRPGIRDLIITARSDGLRLVLVSLLDPKDTERLLTKLLGDRGRTLFDGVISGDREGKGECERLYTEARSTLGIDPKHSLVIEGGSRGTLAAKAAGYSVITTRSAFCRESPVFSEDSVCVDDLTSLLAARDRNPHDPLTPEDRADLLSVLNRLHASKCEGLTGLDWSDQMKVSDILKTKGSAVKTIEANATMRALAHSFRKESVGAMLVLDSKGCLEGIISERDLARGIDEFGMDLPQMRVANLMTRSVVTCAPDDRVAAVANVMTQRRIRHLPVVVEGKVVGLISIGDVLKHRLDEVQLEASVLRDVARSRR
ncbi:CBS domain-containing protein [Hyphomicrobium sp.]|uniref:CBS domain-containing protein n=1 Tax=Hyphomicrobium sp. TaxID=82 RepID=UPI000FA5F422|nr:CBS domain-containing protein [Hyphomicrobium sp.]MBN9247925.1 CBS domain-containing protein [Hyphomicrobium sp.]RUP07448.1 MAG: CBS domain-containing protein [Hyphomicrobium sp.]